MPLLKGNSKKTISKNIRTNLIEKGNKSNHKQAVAIALPKAHDMKESKTHEKGEKKPFEKKEDKGGKLDKYDSRFVKGMIKRMK